jgi:hypothetical protein
VLHTCAQRRYYYYSRKSSPRVCACKRIRMRVTQRGEDDYYAVAKTTILCIRFRFLRPGRLVLDRILLTLEK